MANIKKLLIVGLMISLLAVLGGCSPKSGQASETPADSGTANDTKTVEINTDEDSLSLDDVTEVEEPAIDLTGKAKAPLTGLYVDESLIGQRPIVAMLDNHFGARPQAGLKDADIIYEILAEGNITRYMAVFQSAMPENLGPIRSARPYYISRALEYDPYYVHVGGSEQAKKDIKALNMADIDGLSSGSNVFWRLKHKRIPHNMYSNASVIIKEGDRKGYRTEVSYDTLKFKDAVESINGSACIGLDVIYIQPTTRDKDGYHVGFVYNEETKLYERLVNGKPYSDENDGTELAVTNVIVQYASHKVLDSEGRLEVGIIGSGDGYYISAGEIIKMTWKKADRSSLTRYYNENGEELALNPGKSWIQVVPSTRYNDENWVKFDSGEVEAE
ncbi:MAG: DUF3048 domain-containing protein [Clostridia bacterium]|nr:DUF3048 domain-containing protein [Clostridia bacterium]